MVLCMLLFQSESPVWLSVTPWAVAHHAPLSMGFSRQAHWSGLPFPIPEDLPTPEIETTRLMSPALAGGFFPIPLIYLSSFVNKLSGLLHHCSKSWSQAVSVFFVLFLQYHTGHCGSFLFSYKLWINMSVNIHKITCWDFDWECIESLDQVGKDSQHDNIESSHALTQNHCSI